MAALLNLLDGPALSGLTTLLGSLVGGSATIASAWVTQRGLERRHLVAADVRAREQLYAEFVAECTRLLIDAYSSSLERAATVLPAYALLNRIRLLSSAAVIAAADQVVRRTTEQYFAPSLSIGELRDLARSGTADPLRDFAAACRRELAAMGKLT